MAIIPPGQNAGMVIFLMNVVAEGGLCGGMLLRQEVVVDECLCGRMLLRMNAFAEEFRCGGLLLRRGQGTTPAAFYLGLCRLRGILSPPQTHLIHDFGGFRG